MGEEWIAKRLDRFFKAENLLEKDLMLKQWVDSGVDSNHLPIFLEIQKTPGKLASPFKLCSAWLKNEEVLQIIQNKWKPFQETEGGRATIHFSQNMILINFFLKGWAQNKKRYGRSANHLD